MFDLINSRIPSHKYRSFLFVEEIDWIWNKQTEMKAKKEEIVNFVVVVVFVHYLFDTIIYSLLLSLQVTHTLQTFGIHHFNSIFNSMFFFTIVLHNTMFCDRNFINISNSFIPVCVFVFFSLFLFLLLKKKTFVLLSLCRTIGFHQWWWWPTTTMTMIMMKAIQNEINWIEFFSFFLLHLFPLFQSFLFFFLKCILWFFFWNSSLILLFCFDSVFCFVLFWFTDLWEFIHY